MLSWTSGGSLVSAVAAILTAGLLLANTESVVYGDFGVLIALAFLISNGLRLGADRMIVGEVRRSSSAASEQIGEDLLAFSAGMGVVGSIVLLVFPVRLVLDLTQSTPLSRTEVCLFAVLVALDTFRLTAAEALRAQLRVVVATMSSSGGRSVVFGLAVVVLSLRGAPVTRVSLLAAAVSASLLLVGHAWRELGRDYRVLSGRPLERVRTHWRGHVAMAVATLATTIVASADVWLVGSLVGATAAARYSLSVSAVGLVGIVLTASHVGIQPYLAERLGRGAKAEAQLLASRLSAVGAVAGGFGLLVAVAAGEPVAVALGGDDYRGVRWLILVLGLGVMSALLIGPASAALTATGRYAVLGRSATAAAVFALVAEVGAGVIIGSELAVAFGSAAAVTLLHASSWRQIVTLEGIRTDGLGALRR